MRLNPRDIAAIKRRTADIVGLDARVRLFGSRVNDQARGGDVDLLVELDRPLEDWVRIAIQLEAALIGDFAGREVDVVIAAPNISEKPIHAVARQTGVLL
jgi:predicted nucleotidyltransferase